jgi:nucleotide-binding universal stress UspA family protein
MTDSVSETQSRILHLEPPMVDPRRREETAQGMAGLRTILVGLDGSPEGRMAVQLSLRWARATGARLVGLGIVDEPSIRRAEPVPLGAGSFKRERDERLVEDARRRVEEFLDDFARRCAAQGVACSVIEKVGVPYEQIALEEESHDLVVLPRRSHFHFETERGPDDTVERVLRHGARPIITVPQQPGKSGPVIIAYHGGVHAARALQAFQSTGLESDAQILVVSVHKEEREARERAERAVSFLASHGIPARPAIVVDDEPAAPAILRVVAAVDARLIVAGAGDHHRIAELFSPSVTRTLLREAQVPLFLYR